MSGRLKWGVPLIAAMVVANLIAWAYLLGPWSDAEPSGAPTEPDATPTAFVENVRALTSR